MLSELAQALAFFLEAVAQRPDPFDRVDVGSQHSAHPWRKISGIMVTRMPLSLMTCKVPQVFHSLLV